MGSKKQWGMIALVVCAIILGGLLVTGKLQMPGSPQRLPSGNYAPQFRISKETTAITEPLDEEGYPDFEAAVNARLGKGIEPKNNKVVALFEILGPKPDGKVIPAEFFRRLQMTPPPEDGVYLATFDEFLKKDPTVEEKQFWGIARKELDPAMTRPWNASSFPRTARWVEAQEPLLDKVLQASRRPDFYFPEMHLQPLNGPDDFLKVHRPSTHYFRTIAELLLCRTWRRVDEGNFEGAKEDLMACFRIYRRNPIGSGFEGILFLPMDLRFLKSALVLLEYLPFTKSQLQEWKGELDALPGLFSLSDLTESHARYEILQQVIQFSRLGDQLKPWTKRMMMLPANDEVDQKIEKEMGVSLVDWDSCLKTINLGVDQIASLHRITNSPPQEAQWKKLQEMWGELWQIRLEELGSNPGFLWRRADAQKLRSQLLAELHLRSQAGVHGHLQWVWERDLECRRLLEISLGLAMFRREKGEYPEHLSALLPSYLKTIPDDIYSGGPHIYQKTQEGFHLYSIGRNQIDDGGGKSPYSEPRGDDLSVRVPVRPFSLNHPDND